MFLLASAGDHPASYPIGPCPEVKQLGHEVDHSPPSSTKVRKSGTIPPLPHTSSTHGA
jgi:hypothetical protein